MFPWIEFPFTLTSWALVMSTATIIFSHWAAECPQYFGPDALKSGNSEDLKTAIKY